MKIVHVFRDPVGGLFRHVRDLTEAQNAAGHAVGIVCDSSNVGKYDNALLEGMRPHLALGITRFPMHRQLGAADLPATLRVAAIVRSLAPDVLHGQGAKGGAYARAAGTFLRATGTRVARIYTPHGGSLNFDAKTNASRIYFAAERMLGRMTDAFIFVSKHEAALYAEKVGAPRAPATVVPNGVKPEEFEPVTPNPDAADFLFIGHLRPVKALDIFIAAMALLRQSARRPPTAVIVGGGEDKPHYVTMAAEAGLSDIVTFRDPMPAREAFRLAHTVVIPSRTEAMPYIVLETVAAGMPLISTRVGGIPEIFGPESDRLVPPGDPAELAAAMAAALDAPEAARADAERLKALIRPVFSVDAMTAAIEGVYRSAIAR